MLTAVKSKWFEKLFRVYNRNLIRRRFSSFSVDNIETFDKLNRKIPTVIYLNHSSWWDGLVIFELSAFCALDSIVIMEERNLRRYFLFRRLGAFSVDRNNSRSAIESLNYAVNELQNSGRILWIFPQGEILPENSRPIRFYRGFAFIIEKLAKCQTIPIAVNYRFGENFKPEIFVKIGDSEFFERSGKFQRSLKTREFEMSLTALLDSLNADINSANTLKYRNIL